jgi:hypothetical protein
MPPQIFTFVIDDDNAAKFAAHGLEEERIVQVLDGHPIILANRRNRRATHLVIGTDWGGRCIAIPIEPTSDPTVWRPVTAWPCKRSEALLLRRRR